MSHLESILRIYDSVRDSKSPISNHRENNTYSPETSFADFGLCVTTQFIDLLPSMALLCTIGDKVISYRDMALSLTEKIYEGKSCWSKK